MPAGRLRRQRVDRADRGTAARDVGRVTEDEDAMPRVGQVAELVDRVGDAAAADGSR